MFPHDKLDWQISRMQKRLADGGDTDARLELARAALSKARFHDGGESWLTEALGTTRFSVCTKVACACWSRAVYAWAAAA